MPDDKLQSDLDVIGEDPDVTTSEEEEPTKEEPKKEEESEEEEEEEEEPKKEDKEEDEDEDEEEEPAKVAFDRPSVKELKTKYPNLFKDFPSLKDAFFREREFTSIFPTVEDAREAFDNNESYERLEEAAFNGDPAPLMESLSKSDKKAHDTFAMAFLPDLYKRDQDVYGTVVTPLFENLVRAMYKTTDENLRNSAVNLAEYLWGPGAEDVAKGLKTLSSSVRVDKEQEALANARSEQIAAKFSQTYTEVDSEIRQQLKIVIMRDLDPQRAFSKLIRGQLANEVVRRVYKQLESDEAHKTVMGARWKRAKSNGYTESDKSKIISAFLARARTLMPATMEKVRKAALGKTADKDVPRKQTVEYPREARGGRPTSGKPPAPKVDYRKMSDLEILQME